MEVSGRRQVGSDDLKTGILCDPCKGEDEDENAVCYCSVCNEFLCANCTKAHKRAKVSKHHQLLERDSMPRQKFMSSEESMCTKHYGKLVEYYCKIHEDCFCFICATIEHKQCKVQYIDDIATEFEKSKEYTSLMSVIADLTQLLHNTKQISLNKKNDLGRIHVKFVSELKKFRAEINQMLDILEQSTLTQADTVRDKDTQSIESVSTTCDVLLTDLEKMSSTIETHKKCKQQRQLVISAKKYQNQVKQYDSLTAELSKECTIRDYCFRPNESIIQSIKSVKFLGQLNDGKKEEGQIHLEKRGMELEKLSTQSKSVSLESVGEFNIQHFTDTSKCCIRGGVMLDNNMLAFIELLNPCVKVVDVYRNGTISCIQLPKTPQDIARVDRNQIVVTCGKTLTFIKVGKVLSVEKVLDIVDTCQGIVYTNKKLLVTFGFPNCVRILDIEGQLIKTISGDKTRVQCEYQQSHMVLSTDQKTLYVSEMVNDSVTSMDLDGNVHHVYKHDELKCPCGLAVDREDNVYIAGFGSNNIHMISPQCNNLKVFQYSPETMVSPPWAVTYCEKDNRLYISHMPYVKNYPEANTVHVYQL